MFMTSAHKKVVQQLQQTVAQQAALLEALDRSMARIEFDLKGIVLTANDNFQTVMGYRAADIIGKEHRTFCEPEHARSAEYIALWTRLRAGEFVSGTFQRLTADGRTVWLEASYNPVRGADGKVERIVKYAADVTARIRSENEAKGKLQAIDRAMAIVEFDPQGKILHGNRNALTLFGYSEQELAGKQHSALCPSDVTSSADYEDFWRRLNRGEFFSGQFKRLDRQGRAVWLEATYNPVYDADGKLWKIVKFATDVTNRIEKHEQDAHRAAQAYHISMETSRVAEQGTEVIQQAATEMREISRNIDDSSRLIGQLGERSEQITTIVNTIRGIAEQTNLLALNAAIEAARAGDQGRGFAVVADEVRQLAGRTSRSTQEISDMIQVIQTETRQAIDSMDTTRTTAARGVDLADQAGTVIVRISDGTNEALNAVRGFAQQ